MLKSNVPAKRYDLFIKAFEKEVEKAQAKIRKMDGLMRPYESCRAALEKANLVNETELSLHEQGITIRIVPLDDDRKGFCDQLLKDIGASLKQANLHADGQPADSVCSCDFYYRWRLRGFEGNIPTVTVRLDVPLAGTKYIKIIETNRQISTIESVDRKPVWIADVLQEVEQLTAKPDPDNEIPF